MSNTSIIAEIIASASQSVGTSVTLDSDYRVLAEYTQACAESNAAIFRRLELERALPGHLKAAAQAVHDQALKRDPAQLIAEFSPSHHASVVVTELSPQDRAVAEMLRNNPREALPNGDFIVHMTRDQHIRAMAGKNYIEPRDEKPDEFGQTPTRIRTGI